MNNNRYSDNELQLMSYQELRRLSILLQLPANIKKKYMISMIQAHQKGDGCMKTAIANKIMEERKVKRLNKKKQSKSFMLGSSESTQQIPADLSVSTQHEFETRFSYVAHYSKDDISSEISRIIKQEAEVSRRNRSILQQPRKQTRKISTVGRTEIILPRNHSLTTPVRLMPQYEREFPPAGNYETMTGLSNAKNHFQDLNYNYQFHEEYSNTLMPTTSHELYRNEPYWHTISKKEVYNNSLMPILSSLLTPSSVAINSSSYTSHYTSGNSMKGPTSFQGVYENYIKNNSVIENQAFQCSATNSTTLIVNNHHLINSSSCNSLNRWNYFHSKGDTDYETPLNADEMNCQHCNKRETTAIKNSNESQGLLDFYSSRNAESHITSQTPHITSMRNVTQCNNVCFTTENKDISVPVAHSPFESSIIAYKTTKTVNYQDETDVTDHEVGASTVDGYESIYTEEGKVWEESENEFKKLIGRSRIEKENLESGFLTTQSQRLFLSDVSDASTNFCPEIDLTDKHLKTSGKETPNFVTHFSRCRFTMGHNKYPESVTDSNKVTDLPSFLSTFCSNETYSRAYSICKNSFTGTTETHLNPIMTCTYVPQFSSHTQQTQNSSSGTHIQRQWCYTYPESQVPFPLDSATWNEYSSGMDGNVIPPQNNPNVQIVKCRTHGCHYFYSVSNSCD